MTITFRVHFRSWVPDLDGGEGHAHERKPREFDTQAAAHRYLYTVDRLYDWRIHKITEEVVAWGDPTY